MSFGSGTITKMTDYKTDLELVEKIIDYAHSKAIMIQVPMYLGWEFYHITDKEVCLSENYDRWMEVYDYYLKNSPQVKQIYFYKDLAILFGILDITVMQKNVRG